MSVNVQHKIQYADLFTIIIFSFDLFYYYYFQMIDFFLVVEEDKCDPT